MHKAYDLTFIAWGDPHFGYQQCFGNYDFRWDIIEQMNQLSGWPYPEHIGGVVDKPAFSMLCGDFIDGSRNVEYELAIYRHFSRRQIIPAYETLGNHDIEALNWFSEKYGATSYSFEHNAIHCISLAGTYNLNEKCTFAESELSFLRNDLSALNNDKPIILFTHSPINKCSNAQELINIIKNHRVILSIAAHEHIPAFYKLSNIDCIDLGHCRSHPIDCEYGRSFCVIHIHNNTITALPWRWDHKDWEKAQRWGKYGNEPVSEIANTRFLLQSTF